MGLLGLLCCLTEIQGDGARACKRWDRNTEARLLNADIAFSRSRALGGFPVKKTKEIYFDQRSANQINILKQVSEESNIWMVPYWFCEH